MRNLCVYRGVYGDEQLNAVNRIFPRPIPVVPLLTHTAFWTGMQSSVQTKTGKIAVLGRRRIELRHAKSH